jgi:hypothetical protein
VIHFNVPGLGDYQLEHLVMDVNGTLAVDGQLLEGCDYADCPDFAEWLDAERDLVSLRSFRNAQLRRFSR